MTFKDQSVLDDKYYTRPTSTIIVDDASPTTATTAAIIDITKSVSEDEKHLVKEAGQGGAVIGFIVGGPIGSALLGFGSAYGIRKPKDSTLGKSSRWIAEKTLSVKGKVFNEEEKHHFVKRSKTTIDKFCGDNNTDNDNDNDNAIKNKSSSNSNSNSDNNIAFKTREFVVSGWDAASKYTKENQLLERGVEETGKGIEYLARWGRRRNQQKKKVSLSSSSNNNDNNNDNDDTDNNITNNVSSSSSTEFDDDDTILYDDEHTKLVTTATTN